MDRRIGQRRKGPRRSGVDRRGGHSRGPERRVRDRRSGLDRRQLDLQVDYRLRHLPVIHCSGRITIGPTVTDFTAKCSELLRGRALMALDMSDITHIDSSGVGALLNILTHARRRTGDVKLVAPSKKVESALKITFLYQLFEIFPTAEEAAERTRPKSFYEPI